MGVGVERKGKCKNRKKIARQEVLNLSGEQMKETSRDLYFFFQKEELGGTSLSPEICLFVG